MMFINFYECRNYETMNICRDDDTGKAESAEVVSSYLEEDGLIYKKKSEKDAESLVPHMNRAILGSLCIFFEKLAYL